MGSRPPQLGRGRVRGRGGCRAWRVAALRLAAGGRRLRRPGGRGDPLRRAVPRGHLRLAQTPTVALAGQRGKWTISWLCGRRSASIQQGKNRSFEFASHSNDDFSLGPPFSDLTNSFRDLAQRVRLIDDRRELAGLDEFFHKIYIFYVWSNHQDAYLVARGSSDPWSQEQNLQHRSYRTSGKE